jgi:hypothetical protein
MKLIVSLLVFLRITEYGPITSLHIIQWNTVLESLLRNERAAIAWLSRVR